MVNRRMAHIKPYKPFSSNRNVAGQIGVFCELLRTSIERRGIPVFALQASDG
jgi:hypothetical protein